MNKRILGGVVHSLPPDLKRALLSSTAALAMWQDNTPLARNEWICWIISVKTEATRARHIERAIADLAKGKRRPCCWAGCIHRTDKPLSPSQRYAFKQLKQKE